MQVIHGTEFTASRAWGARDITVMDGTSICLHWTDRPYHWHVNDGEEVFVVLDGAVDMHVRDAAGERIIRLAVGDIFHADRGDEHVAHPLGVARILVIERAGSV
jgi:mannose-6-phosphate isomerase-like protein (cupin superfamily)